MDCGFEMSEFGHTNAALDEGRVETTDVDEAIHEGATVDTLSEDKQRIHEQETALETYKWEILAEQWERLKETKVDAYLNVVAARTGLLLAANIYAEFYLGKDGWTLYLKNGTLVTHLKVCTQYRRLKDIDSVDYIRIHLFPDYTAGQHGGTLQPLQKKSLVNTKTLTTQATVENTELVICRNVHLTSTPLLNNYSQRLVLAPTVSPYEICLHWMMLYSVIVVHLLII